MTSQLSPATQAIWDAHEKAQCDPYVIDPRRAELAAAFRAATELPYEVPAHLRGDDYWSYRSGVEADRERLIAISDELHPLEPEDA